MDGLLSLVIVCIMFALFICLVNRSVRMLMVTAAAVVVFVALKATGVLD